MSDKNLAAYIFNHYWQFEFLRPTIDEIVTKYLEMHGSAAPEEKQKKATSLTQTRRRRRRRWRLVVVDEQEQEQMLK